ncbi:MAG TPA: VOC family protein [Gemmatimonadaceae bacterium]|nr:VOC family protein [Gemmatimonadaceae bacterium]
MSVKNRRKPKKRRSGRHGTAPAGIKRKGPAVRALQPYLVVDDAARAIEFYTQAFGARETNRLTEPNGKVAHAELSVGKAAFMLADEHREFNALSPTTIGNSPVRFHLSVADADAVIARAVAAGAKVLRPIKDEFYGERTGMILDPFGHSWFIAATIEEVSAEEVQRRFTAALARR